MMTIEYKDITRNKLTISANGDIRVKIKIGTSIEIEQEILNLSEELVKYLLPTDVTIRIAFLIDSNGLYISSITMPYSNEKVMTKLQVKYSS